MEGYSLVNINKVVEEDGILYVMEGGKEIPFEIKRIFFVSNVTSGKSRGNHATLKTRLILFPISGKCNVVVDNGFEKVRIAMEKKEQGILIDPMIWRSMEDFSDDCVMMAVCDRHYSPGCETIDDYEEYIRIIKTKEEE